MRGLRVLACAAAAMVPLAGAFGQTKTGVVIGMPLEPPGLDPTTGAASAIAEITQYNIFEGLTKINADNTVTPLLADSWTLSPDGKTTTFKLRAGAAFQNGEKLDASSVKFSFERAAASTSTNKDKAFFAAIQSVDTPDAATVAITLKSPNPDLLYHLGLSSAVIVEPKSAATDATQPVGSGPYRLAHWNKGSAVTLTRWDGYRAPQTASITTATFRFISDPAAQVAALLAGDVDAFPRFASYPSVGQFQSDKRFAVMVGTTEGKTVLSINNTKKPFDDVRVRRAIAAAIDRKSVIDGAMNGFGTPIGSHMVPVDPGYVDLTGVNSYDPKKAKELLAEAGVKTPLDVTLTLPPPVYARQGGEIIAAELAEVGINAKIENVEFAQWLAGAFKGNFDLTIISHVEPLDLATVYGNPDYYIHYNSAAFRDILARAVSAPNESERLKALGDAQRKLADDSVVAFLFALPQITISKVGLAGLWKDGPVFVNDLAALKWQ